MRKEGALVLASFGLVFLLAARIEAQPQVSDPFPQHPGVATVVGGEITQNATWPGVRLPYLVTSNIYVRAGATLTIEPGAVIKFMEGRGLWVFSGGTLIANGTASRPIVFTSIKDDELLDTNQDGDLSAPAPNDWAGLSFEGNRDIYGDHAAFGSLTHARLRYGSSLSVRYSAPVLRDVTSSHMSFTALYIDTPPAVQWSIERMTLTDSASNLYLYRVPASTTIRESVFRGATGVAAIQADQSAAQLYHNAIDGNGTGNLSTAIQTYGTSPLYLRYNSITNNRRPSGVAQGVDAIGSATVDARYNWWGSTSGPELEYAEKTGGGSQVRGNVLYSDWLGSTWAEEHKKGTYPWTLKAGIGTDVATGNFVLTEKDLSIATIGFPLEIVRTYNGKTADTSSSEMGAGWTWSYGTNLNTFADGHGVVWERPDGAKSYFKRLPGNGFSSEEGVYEKLAYVPRTATYVLTHKDQTRWEFDSAGRLMRQIDQDGNTTTVQRDAAGKILSIQEPTGRRLTLTYDGSFIATITDPLNRVIRYSRGWHNGLTSVEKRDGGGSLFGICTYQYTGPASAMTSMTDSDGNMLTQTFDGSKRVVSQRFNGNNEIRFIYGPTTDSWADWVPENTTAVVDTRGRVHHYYYTHSNKVYSHQRETSYIYGERYFSVDDEWRYASYLTSSHQDLDGLTKSTYDWSSGNLKQLEQPGGRTTSHTYDASNNRTSTTDPLGRITRYEYDSEHHPERVVDAHGQVTTMTYGFTGLLSSVTDVRGNTTHHTYDAWGYPASVTNAENETTTFGYDAGGRKVWEENPLGERTWISHDGRDQVVAVQDPLGNVTSTSYDVYGRKLSATDAEGRTTSFEYDGARNTLTRTVDARGGSVRFFYDRHGANLIEVIDANNHSTRFEYDELNRRTAEIDAQGRVTRMSYVGRDRVASITDAAGATTTYAYDASNQVSRINYQDGLSVTFTYDGAGNRVSMTDWTGTTSWIYDALGRVVQISRGGNDVGYAYDAGGNLTLMIYEPGKSVVYRYDGANRMKDVRDWTGRLTTYTYDRAGRVTSWQFPNGVLSSQRYDRAGRVTSIDSTSGGATYLSLGYTFDRVGNRTSRRFIHGTESYSYDELHRLISVTYLGGAVESFTYDAAGNRLSRTANGVTDSYIYDAADHLTWDSRDGSRSHDANGALLYEGPKAYFWDVRHRLGRVTESGGSWDFVYDADGNRVRQLRNGVATDYVLNTLPKNEEVLIERSGGASKYFVYGHDLLYVIDGNGPHYHLTDTLGSVLGTANAGGGHETGVAFDVFGALLSYGSYLPSRGFTGEETDSTNLVYLRARYYNPATGRFLSRDPFPSDALDTQTVNRYVYVKNNPTNYVDPSGEVAIAIPAIPYLFAGGAAIAAAIPTLSRTWSKTTPSIVSLFARKGSGAPQPSSRAGGGGNARGPSPEDFERALKKAGWIAGPEAIRHFMTDRPVPAAQIIQVLQHGARYLDPTNSRLVSVLNRLNVVTEGNRLVTFFRGPPTPRWIPIRMWMPPR